MIFALFAGIDGWTLADDAVHIELDPDACATLAALGVPTVRADVATFPLEHLRDVEGIVASPPCQTFSTAGDQEGVKQLGAIVEHAHRCVDGWHPWAASTDPRTELVLEPLRWALALHPRWIALEQVRAVLPVWEAIAHVLRGHGYSTWAGTLEAADYGVPQTRTRAILMAHQDRAVHPPEPTHAKDPAPGLFGTLEPWVTMADALGWGLTHRPYPTLASGRTSGGPDKEKVGGSGARKAIYDEVDAGRFLLNTGRRWPKGGDRSGAQTIDPTTQPAPAVTAISGGQWLITEREPGLVGTHVAADVADRKPWAYDRPATTLATRPLVADPGTNANRFNGATKSRNDGIKITVPEALVLQSFPPDYPVQGSRTAQFRQVGNAIPLGLGRAILSALR